MCDPRFDAVATLRIGPVKATFKAVIRQTELDPPRRCVLKGEGQGGVAGFARGVDYPLRHLRASRAIKEYSWMTIHGLRQCGKLAAHQGYIERGHAHSSSLGRAA